MNVMAIEGGLPLYGEAEVHGAKNAVLPVLSAALLCPKATIRSCPLLSDVWAARRILEHLGCRVSTADSERTLQINASSANGYGVPESLAGEMRSSIIFLGALLARWGKAHIALPGGCRLGPRPIDLHISGLRQMGVRIIEQEDGLLCSVDGTLKGADICLKYPSVGATENLLIAASLAKGITTLRGMAMEPEIDGLIDFLNRAGARIYHKGDCLCIEGVELLHDVDYTIIPDRIEAATYLSAAATGGEITLKKICLPHLASVLPVFEEMGCMLKTKQDEISLSAPKRLSHVRSLSTAPYPGFPTDALAPVMAASLLADGASRFEELVFQSRYLHVNQFEKMGANVHMEGRTAFVDGVPFLRSARLHCTDLRGGAALVIAALAAKGVSFIDELQHIYRGYDDMPAVIRQLGGKVWMISSGSIRIGKRETNRKKEEFSNLGYTAGIPLTQTQGVL